MISRRQLLQYLAGLPFLGVLKPSDPPVEAKAVFDPKKAFVRNDGKKGRVVVYTPGDPLIILEPGESRNLPERFTTGTADKHVIVRDPDCPITMKNIHRINDNPWWEENEFCGIDGGAIKIGVENGRQTFGYGSTADTPIWES